MALGGDLDRDAIGVGLRNGLLLVVPAGLFSAALTDDLPQLLRVLFVLVIIAGFVSAGNHAAKRAQRAVLASASVAAALTYLAVQAPLSVIRLVRGEPLNVWTYIFLVLTSMSCGVIGGLIELRAQRKAELAAERAAERAAAEAAASEDDEPGAAPTT